MLKPVSRMTNRAAAATWSLYRSSVLVITYQPLSRLASIGSPAR
jgi:hypothetical protein